MSSFCAYTPLDIWKWNTSNYSLDVSLRFVVVKNMYDLYLLNDTNAAIFIDMYMFM